MAFPDSSSVLDKFQLVINSKISGTGKGEPARNLGSTLPGPCPHLPTFRGGSFLK